MYHSPFKLNAINEAVPFFTKKCSLLKHKTSCHLTLTERAHQSVSRIVLPQRGEKKSRHANARLLLVSFIKSGVEDDGEADVAGEKATPDGSAARAIIVSDNATRLLPLLGEIFALANGPLWKIFLG